MQKGWSGFAYIYHGAGSISGTQVSPQHTVVLGEGDHIAAASDDDEGLRFLLVAGQPIGEPIVQHGPFVMNTQEEIHQAFRDYQSGQLQRASDNVWEDDE